MTVYDHKNVDLSHCIKMSPSASKEQTKMLIVGDQYAKNLDRPLRKLMSCRNVTVESFVKPGATFDRVLESLVDLTKDYTEKDYVLVLAGVNDLSTGKFPRIKNINFNIRNCLHTNIVFLSTPGINVDCSYFVHNFNQRLRDYVEFVDGRIQHSISFVNVCDGQGYMLSKPRVSSLIVNHLMSLNKMKKNLIFVNTTKSVNSDLNDGTAVAPPEPLVILDEERGQPEAQGRQCDPVVSGFRRGLGHPGMT